MGLRGGTVSSKKYEKQVYPCLSQFYYIYLKVEYRGGGIHCMDIDQEISMKCIPFTHFIWHVFFFTSSDQSRYTLWSCQNVCDALSYLLDNIYIRFGTKLNRQIVGIPMGTNCAPLVADLFLYCYERDFMDSLNHDMMLSRLSIPHLGTSMTF